uniref:Uncharacterized protein n=1 Tax=Chrysemys picta bellii TaxID=8478 RepID=A0A8C3HCX8_CHRPI
GNVHLVALLWKCCHPFLNLLYVECFPYLQYAVFVVFSNHSTSKVLEKDLYLVTYRDEILQPFNVCLHCSESPELVGLVSADPC